MLKKEISELINTQVNKELYSAYLYLDFANFFHDKGLDGFANWYEIQTQEERDHAMLMRTYLINNGDSVTFDAVAKPDVEKTDVMTILKAALKHEQYVTSLINNIYAAADAAKDYRTMQFLDWFVKEQGEEEKNADDMIKKYELYGSDAKGLYALNQELLGRVYAAPSLVL
ncbi:MAG: ferritin [Lachnospiraceae bacterium]|jgi:ferritin|nr:ferritin [Lachnospiraceae bacterium]MDD5956464.1 ferritin [Lachnospiraceae bacterium]MDD7665417.1 ferritin [Lachnospiraceae bacterium]MDY4164659.1 ferritin [Lachnospiraceae bacterium]HAP03377.1 ferritin [Lachnospiraceae bacterium]